MNDTTSSLRARVERLEADNHELRAALAQLASSLYAVSGSGRLAASKPELARVLAGWETTDRPGMEVR